MNPENHVLENRQGDTEEHEAEQAEPTKQDSAQAELIAPTGSEANVSERGVEKEIPQNVRSKENDENENVDETLSYNEGVAGSDQGPYPARLKRRKRGKKKAEAGLADIFDFRYITYFHLADWTTHESKGVMEVLLDQTDDQVVPAPLMNKGGEKDDATATNKNAKQDKNIGVLSPSWSKTKALQLMIHSQALIANLKGLDRKLNWHTHMTNHGGRSQRVVFIRPFKFLVLKEAEIRERFKELDKYRANLPPLPPPPPPPLPPPPPPPISPPLSVLDSPLQTVAHAVMDNGDSQSDLNKSEIWNEETEHSNAQHDEETIVVDTEATADVLAQVQENENQDSETQALVSIVSEEISKDEATSGADTGGEVPSLTKEHFQTGEQSSTEHATETPKDPDLGVASPGNIAVSDAEENNLEEPSKAVSEQKLVTEELRLGLKAAEEELAKLKPSLAPKPPIKFKDAVGRKFSFPWALCKTWKGMEELIKQAFLHVDIIGPHVFEGHYDLVGPDGEIILPQVWDIVIQPDWAITMHMWPMPEPPPPPPEDDGLILRDSQDALEDFRLLIRFLDEDLKDIFDMRKQIEEGTLDKIAFDDLWHLFHYGEEVIWHDQDKSSIEKPRAARVLKFTGGRSTKADYNHSSFSRTGTGALGPGSWGHAFVVQCWTMTFDGSFFWPEEVVVGIRPYEGERDISALPIYPSKFDRAGLLADLIEHGKIYRHFTQQTFSHRKYLGKNYESDRGEEIDSEVIIDFREAASSMSQRTYGSESEFKSPEGDQIGHDMRELWVEYPEHGLCGQKGWCIRDVIGPDFALDNLELDAFLRDNNHTMQAKETIKDSEVAILPDRVPGYVLNRKIWAMLSTSKSNLMEFQATSDPWNDLVLEQKQKVIIEALVAKHLHHPTDSNELETPYQLGDFVAGKGRSIVLLLHGPPGVGKTSTAECIAAHMEKPLYPLTSGNLPVRANDLEEQLQVHFNLAARWGCILLLDEADVFLQRRRLNELEINAMVSVFLRQLEYYRGILFLTTNRVGDIDPAFKSRIHVSLEYEPLDRKRTKKIYKLHLRRIKEALELRKSAHGTAFKVKGDEILAWSDQHFKRTSKRHRQWNGRQIHNAFQTAVALAEWEARTKVPESHEQGPRNLPQLVLGKKQFKQVSQVSEGFDQYMTDLMGGRNEAELAAVSAQRYDFRPGKDRESQSKKDARSDSDSDDSSGDDNESKEGNSSEDESSDSDGTPKRGGNRKKNESESGQSSDDGKRKRNKNRGKGSQRTKFGGSSSEEVVKSKGAKDAEKNRKKPKSKHKETISDSS